MNTEARMMTASAVTKREEALKHYGVLGMKWGIRRYQPYGQGGYDPEHAGRYIGTKNKPRTAGQYKRQLNKVQRQVDFAQYKTNEYNRESERVWKKGMKETEKYGAISEKTRRKMYSLSNDAAAYQAKVDEGKTFIKNTIKSAENDGFSVGSKDFRTFADKGQIFTAQFLFGVGGTTAALVLNKDAWVDSKKYKVTKSKEDKHNQQIVDALPKGDKDAYNRTYRTITPQQAKTKAEKAKSTDMWNIEFLETIQNDERYGNKDWMAKEYEKFLTDEDYRKKYYQYAKQA